MVVRPEGPLPSGRDQLCPRLAQLVPVPRCVRGGDGQSPAACRWRAADGALPLALTPRRPSPRGTRTAPCGSPAPPPAPPAQAFHLPRCGPPPPWPRTDRGRRLAARLSQEVLSCAAVLLSLAPPPEADDRGHATVTAACGAPAASSFSPACPRAPSNCSERLHLNAFLGGDMRQACLRPARA